jgi:hypothetical protein
LCSLEYKVVRIEILHMYSIHHWLTLEFCFRFLKYSNTNFKVFENKILHVAGPPIRVSLM